jgi:hypothetical protein
MLGLQICATTPSLGLLCNHFLHHESSFVPPPPNTYTSRRIRIQGVDGASEACFFKIVLLFIRAYNAWVISPPCPHPHPYHPLHHLPLPPTPPNLEKTIPIQVQEASRTPNRLDQNGITPRHIIIKTTRTESRERILKAERKKQITYKGKPIKITANFSTVNLKAKRAWNEVF